MKIDKRLPLVLVIPLLLATSAAAQVSVVNTPITKVEIKGELQQGICREFWLRADVEPSGGTYEWSATGVVSMPGNKTLHQVRLRSGCAEGGGTVKLTYKLGGRSQSATETVEIKKPTGERVTPNGWNGAHALFRSFLQPENHKFYGITVAERDGGGGHDSCTYRGGRYEDDPFDKVTGGTWTIGQSNRFDNDDWIGWGRARIEYYRTHPLGSPRAPCGSRQNQKMDVVCKWDCKNNIEYYSTIILVNINAGDTISSIKAGIPQTRVYP